MFFLSIRFGLVFVISNHTTSLKSFQDTIFSAYYYSSKSILDPSKLSQPSPLCPTNEPHINIQPNSIGPTHFKIQYQIQYQLPSRKWIHDSKVQKYIMSETFSAGSIESVSRWWAKIAVALWSAFDYPKIVPTLPGYLLF
ncbi:hypothetical protein BGZ63DRAFT_130013 [Mariannaea sp. PMI_226]|nr:hypothetical protein BGZ63DRAFT_130013 [Mariannaea sp. PMI_226]